LLQRREVPLLLLVGLIALMIGLFASLFVFHFFASTWERLAERTLGWLPHRFAVLCVGVYRQVQKGLSVLRAPKAVLWVLLGTLLLWGLEFLCVICLLRAVHIPFSLGMLLFLGSAANLAFLLPVTPGALGVHQVVCVWVLAFFAVGQEQAMVYSLGMQSCDFLMILSWGGICFAREGLRWSQIQAVEAPMPKDTSSKCQIGDTQAL
ncbi:MAG: lysylphosphatidylglycerol synthase domain-containing protein, partial [Myxococcota bacterium]